MTKGKKRELCRRRYIVNAAPTEYRITSVTQALARLIKVYLRAESGPVGLTRPEEQLHVLEPPMTLLLRAPTPVSESSPFSAVTRP